MSEQKQEKISRRDHILQTLAQELENSPGQRITTASLARAVGVSEAALYRHFPSKARMFEGLIEFIEESVFGLINRILADVHDPAERCEKIMQLLLGFSARNPGISRILVGDVLNGENERLRTRIGQFFDRIELQFKQVLREAQVAGALHNGLPINASANLLLATAEGRLNQYVRSSFKRSPTAEWDGQWAILSAAMFRPAA